MSQAQLAFRPQRRPDLVKSKSAIKQQSASLPVKRSQSAVKPPATSQPSRYAELARTARSTLLPETWTDANDDELLLRKFDLDMRFGPCAGLSRLERWERAQRFGLEPPQHVHDILMTMSGDAAEHADSESSKRIKSLLGVDTLSIFQNVTQRVLAAEGQEAA